MAKSRDSGMPSAEQWETFFHATDIDPLMVGAMITRASQAGLRNVVAEQRDFVLEGCGRPNASMSYVMLFNILHIEDPSACSARRLGLYASGELSA